MRTHSRATLSGLKCIGPMFALITLGSVTGARPMQGQTIPFFRQFATPGMDQATAVAADASGIYVFGSRPLRYSPQPASSEGQGSAGLRKYDSRGNELWTREFSTAAHVVSVWLNKATANETGVYVVGEGGLAPWWVLRKYSTDGDELWTRQLEFAPRDVAVDVSGVYVVGIAYPATSSYLSKYTPDGAELWTRRFGDSWNHGVAVDATGVYILGEQGFGPARSSSGFVRKYDAAILGYPPNRPRCCTPEVHPARSPACSKSTCACRQISS